MATHADRPVMLEISNLQKNYQGLRPLRMASLRLRAGERLAVAGLDVTAAEVLVNLITGATLPDAGEIHVFGRNTRSIATADEWLSWLDQFGIVTNRAVLLTNATITQNLTLALTMDIDGPPPAVRSQVARLAEEVQIDPVCWQQPTAEASADTRMRVHLARALASNPRVLLLEHPTLDLDRQVVPGLARDVATVAGARDLTTLIMTEDREFADEVADRFLRLQASSGALADHRGWRRWF